MTNMKHLTKTHNAIAKHKTEMVQYDFELNTFVSIDMMTHTSLRCMQMSLYTICNFFLYVCDTVTSDH